MKKPLKILVPFDFSRYSQETLHFAISLKEPFAAEFLLLYVIPGGEVETFATLGGGGEEGRGRKLEEAKAELDRIAEGVRGENPDLKVDTRVVEGVPFKQICHLADQENFQLIVIGTHGRTGLSHLLIGSTAERVVQHAPCPVLSIKPRVL
jgi:nucleotide-binding universal stress UspA family protein